MEQIGVSELVRVISNCLADFSCIPADTSARWELRRSSTIAVERLKSLAEMLFLDGVPQHCFDFSFEMRGNRRVNVGEIVQKVKGILDDFIRSAEERHFLYVTRRDLWEITPNNSPDFGGQVCGSFPSIVNDLISAMQCLALEQPTASVYHLMRSLESPLRLLWYRAGSNNTMPRNWQDFLNQIRSEATKLQANSNEQQFLMGAVTYLSVVKDLWRNPSMHDLAREYSSGDAERIMGNVGSALHHLSTILSESP